VTPPRKSVPDVDRSVHVPAIRRRTQLGAAPVRSDTRTVNVNDVDVVPLPGVAAPFSIVIWPHVRASAGLANAAAPTINPPVSAISTTRIDRDRARAGPRIMDSES
jgi:hypothetical protein